MFINFKVPVSEFDPDDWDMDVAATWWSWPLDSFVIVTEEVTVVNYEPNGNVRITYAYGGVCHDLSAIKHAFTITPERPIASRPIRTYTRDTRAREWSHFANQRF